MDNPQQQNLGATLGEISTIRNILMGGQIAEYSERFDAVDKALSKNEQDKNERFEKMEEEINNRFSKLEAQMNERFDRLESLLTENVQRLNERVDNVSTSDKADLGRLLAEVSNRLING